MIVEEGMAHNYKLFHFVSFFQVPRVNLVKLSMANMESEVFQVLQEKQDVLVYLEFRAFLAFARQLSALGPLPQLS